MSCGQRPSEHRSYRLTTALGFSLQPFIRTVVKQFTQVSPTNISGKPPHDG
jgi:hypothetical protein